MSPTIENILINWVDRQKRVGRAAIWLKWRNVEDYPWRQNHWKMFIRLSYNNFNIQTFCGPPVTACLTLTVETLYYNFCQIQMYICMYSYVYVESHEHLSCLGRTLNWILLNCNIDASNLLPHTYVYICMYISVYVCIST